LLLLLKLSHIGYYFFLLHSSKFIGVSFESKFTTINLILVLPLDTNHAAILLNKFGCNI